MKATYYNKLEIADVLEMMVDSRKKLSREVHNYVRQNFKVCVYENNIRSNVKAAEAPSFETSVISLILLPFRAVREVILQLLMKHC
jgi:chromosome partitioning protein